MTGAWIGGHAVSAPATLGAVTATSSGTVMAGATTAYAKGAWYQLSAATATDSNWIVALLQTLTSGGQYFAIDIGVGASGSEVAIINNLVCSAPGSYSNVYQFPFAIPAGTRVSARFSSSIGYDTMPIVLLVFQDTYQSAGTGSAIDTYGFSITTNLGTLIDPGGTINTKGAYSQITSATTADIAGIVINWDPQTSSTGTTIPQWLVDIAVGASGSEAVVISNQYLVAYSTGAASLFMSQPQYIPLRIPAGTRIAIRAQCSTANTPDRYFGATIYGVRQ